MGRIQAGHVYEASGAFFVRYYATAIVDGTSARVQRSERLCEKNDKYHKFQDWVTAHFIRELLVDLPLALLLPAHGLSLSPRGKKE